MRSQLSRPSAKQQPPLIEGTDPSTMTAQEMRSQLLSESPHSPATERTATESMDSLTPPTPFASYSSLEAFGSFASICASTMNYLGLDPAAESSSIALLPQKKSFRNRRPLAIETSWDTVTTAEDEPSSIQHPPSPKNSAQSGHFFGSSPRSVMDSSDSSTRQFF